MNHKLLHRNDISRNKRTLSPPLDTADKGNKFHAQLEYKHISSRLELLRFGTCYSQTAHDARLGLNFKLI